ncbi:MAG TPA: M23 family metallopeptidase [Candidatus Limnocylindria bacterium]
MRLFPNNEYEMRTRSFGWAWQTWGRTTVLRAKLRSGPAAGILTVLASQQLVRRTLIVAVNLLVASVVMALPFIASAASAPASTSAFSASAVGSTSLAPSDAAPQVSRAAPAARGGTIAAGRNPVTVQAQGVRPIGQYVLSESDTLWSIANFYGLSAEAIAFANGISDPYHLQVGRQIMIPPLEGALYTVAAGDTIEAVAARFKVDQTVIENYNRLYFEPEHFAPGQLIFVQNAVLPTLPLPSDEPAQQSSVIARAAAPSTPAMSGGGYLAWPVAGFITQYMWAGHTGVDIAAPYGSGLAASVSGVISQNGWVAVGGLHICVKSGNLEECYYHMSAAYYAVGTQVSAGQIVGAIGLTGVTTGPHVHWETKINGQFVNPLAVKQ